MKIPLPACRRAARTGRSVRVLALGAVLLVAGSGVFGATPDIETKDLHLSGFGTLGVVHVNAPAGAGFQRDETERPNSGGTRADVDTRLGLQANYRVSSQVELVGQVVGADRVASAPASDVVSLAFGAWRPNDEVTVRAGRMSTDYYLLADYRHVGFAFPFVRPPVENYGAVPYVLNGIDLTKAWRFDETVWKLRGITGQSQLGNSHSSDALRLRPIYALVLSVDDGDGLSMKASVSRSWLHANVTAVQPLIDALGRVASLPDARVAAEASNLAAAFDYDGHPVTYSSIGVSHDRGAWSASVELTRCEPQSASSYTSAWGLVGHRWGGFTAYGGMSAVHTEQSRSPPRWAAALTPSIGAAAAAQAQQIGVIALTAATGTNANQQTLTVGVRWDLSDRIALKLQWDRVRVDAYATRLWTTSTPGEPIHANIGSAALDFVF